MSEPTATRALRVWVQGIGVLGPGLASWPAAAAVLCGATPLVMAPTLLQPPARLPPAERRRAGSGVKLALAVADEAVAQARVEPALLATVFTSSSGEGINCHVLCETLALPVPLVSPTRFTNSVHNAAAGCWHIAVASRASSTSLCAFDGSFGAGLIEAATSVRHAAEPVLLVASDSPYPEPLHTARPLPDHFGLALVLASVATPESLAELTVELSGAGVDPSVCADTRLEAMRRAIPAAASLPLLQAIARGAAQRVVIEYLPTMRIVVGVVPLAQPASAA